MPRRRIPTSPPPGRLDRRRVRGNATDAQHRPRRGRRGQVETIAGRRAIALELRKAGGSYREIARQLSVDVHTAHADVAAELADLRQETVEEAKELRALELQRLDEMTGWLWPQIRAGSPPAVSAAIRVSERRARLLGLDEPTATRTELAGSLSVTAENQLKAQAQAQELQTWLSFEELRALGAASDKLFADAQALVDARKSPRVVSVAPSPAADVEPVVTSEPAEPPPGSKDSLDERDTP